MNDVTGSRIVGTLGLPLISVKEPGEIDKYVLFIEVAKSSLEVISSVSCLLRSISKTLRVSVLNIEEDCRCRETPEEVFNELIKFISRILNVDILTTSLNSREILLESISREKFNSSGLMLS